MIIYSISASVHPICAASGCTGCNSCLCIDFACNRAAPRMAAPLFSMSGAAHTNTAVKVKDRRLTCELMMRMVVLFPTSFSKPFVGAALKRSTASWEPAEAQANKLLRGYRLGVVGNKKTCTTF